MRLQLHYRGRRFQIYALVLDNGSCPAVEYLEQLKRNNFASFKSLANIYKRHAENGPILNKEKSRDIKGYKDILEFKSRQGDRLLYFYSKGQRTVLTNGFHKGTPAKAEYEKAEKIREQYIREVENG